MLSNWPFDPEQLLFAVRIFNVCWAFGLFMTMIYFGLLDLWLGRKCSHTHVAPEFQLWAFGSFIGVFVYLVATLEEELTQETAGFAVLAVPVFLLIVSAATFNGASRVQHHKVSIAKGACR